MLAHDAEVVGETDGLVPVDPVAVAAYLRLTQRERLSLGRERGHRLLEPLKSVRGHA